MTTPKLRWVVFTATVAFLIAIILTSFFKEVRKVDSLSQILDVKMTELVQEERKTQKLKQDIHYYSTPEGISRLATEHFNLISSGDKIYDIEVTSNDRLQ
ncbi:MAG: septum formation initiator [Synergistes sp.]|nr:septum formation initiator [Synergistes sp.]